MRLSISFLALCLIGPAFAQEGGVGFAVPVTITGGAMYTHRLQTDDPGASPVAGGFRTMLYPSLKLGPHWHAAASVQVSLAPFFYFESNDAKHEFKTKIIQGYLGYTRSGLKNSVTVKAGQLISAFGSFPLRYDDEANALIGAPLSYGSAEYGNFPVTLYGQPGIEVDVNLNRVDARLQFVNSSPTNPQNLLSSQQNPNWVAGVGYTIRQGFRVGASVFHGAYLIPGGRFLTLDENPRDWPDTAVGVDVQWARGHWSTTGEWQRVTYPYPRYIAWPKLHFGYVEVKRVLHPRLYLAARLGYNTYGSFQRTDMPSPRLLRPARQDYEFVIGYRLNRSQIVKVGYEVLHRNGIPGTRENIFGVQLVTSLQPFAKASHGSGSVYRR